MSDWKSDLSWLSETLGPRQAFSTNARLAALGIRDRLIDAGWEPKVAHLPNNIVACRGTGKVVLLAHSDTVPNSPGAIDNAAAVAALLEVARTSSAKDLCLAFPAQEEIGLIGSRHLVETLEKWHPASKELSLVVSLDLVGHGQLSATGLGTQWGYEGLEWLHRNDVQLDYGYHVVSRLLPNMERSDHAPFQQVGIPAFQLLGRNEDGIYPHYHTPEDSHTQVSEQAMRDLFSVLESVTSTPPAAGGLATVSPFGPVPGSMLWTSLISAVLIGVISMRGLPLREAASALLVGLRLTVLCCALAAAAVWLSCDVIGSGRQ